jgi:hypothetical protein
MTALQDQLLQAAENGDPSQGAIDLLHKSAGFDEPRPRVVRPAVAKSASAPTAARGDRQRARACRRLPCTARAAFSRLRSVSDRDRHQPRAGHTTGGPPRPVFEARSQRWGPKAMSRRAPAAVPSNEQDRHGSFHRTMLVADRASVRADFDGVALESGGRFTGTTATSIGWRSGTSRRLALPQARRRRGRVRASGRLHHCRSQRLPAMATPDGFPFTWLIADQQWAPRNEVFCATPEHPR